MCTSLYPLPQDVSLLNEAREKIEEIIFWFHKNYGLELPRRDCKAARKDYLSFAKAKKHSKKQIRKAIRKQLSYVRRNIGCLEGFMSEGYAPDAKDIDLILTIFKLYEQQKYMYDNKVHKVENRIVSIHQPWIRQIVRGKVKAPVEFGAKLDLSIDSTGYARIEKISFDAYNESTCLQDAVEEYFKRNGHYPERVLADQILIIELKRGGFEIGPEEVYQAENYVRQIKTSGALHKAASIHAFVVGCHIGDIDTHKSSESGIVDVVTYGQLVETANMKLFGLRQTLEEHYKTLDEESLVEKALKQPVQMKIKFPND